MFMEFSDDLFVDGPIIPKYNDSVQRRSKSQTIIPRKYIKITKNNIRLCREALSILNEPNAGGKSVNSEAYAMQVLFSIFKARGIRTEMNIVYFNQWWKRCDFITEIKGISYGVSVTRATFSHKYNPDDLDLRIMNLLSKKLSGLVISRAGMLDGFQKSILFVWTADRLTSILLYNIFHNNVDKSLKQDVWLIICELDIVTLTNLRNEITEDFPSGFPLSKEMTIYYS